MPLKGGVEKVELSLERLRGVEADLKQVSKAAGALYDVAMIQPVRLITQPTIVGPGTIVNIPVGTQPTGPPQPVQRKSIDQAIKKMKPIIETMKRDVDDFIEHRKQLDLSNEVKQKLEPRFQEWIDGVNTVTLHENQLEQVAQNPPYDNQTVGLLSQAIQQDVKSLNKTRAAIDKVHA